MTDNNEPTPNSASGAEGQANEARRYFGAVLSWKTASLVLFILIIGVALERIFIVFPNISVQLTNERDGGFILVDSPEIYSRERLLNDRLRQHDWLMELLKKMDDLKFGSQATIEQMDNSQFGANISARAGPLVENSAGAIAPLTTDTRSPAQGVENSAAPGRREANGASSGKPTETNIERFRSRLAYREEIRAELLETQLDDRHDIKGNTLYRLKFDVTVLPQEGNENWAFVEVKLSNDDEPEDNLDVYTRWLKDTQQRLNDYLFELTQAFFTRTAKPEVLHELETFMRQKIPDVILESDYFQKEPSSSPPAKHQTHCRAETISRRLDCLDGFFERVLNAPYSDQIFGRIEATLDGGTDREFDFMRAFILDYMHTVYGKSDDPYVGGHQSPAYIRYASWRTALSEASRAIPAGHDNLSALFDDPNSDYNDLLKTPDSLSPHKIQQLLTNFKKDKNFSAIYDAFQLTADAFELERHLIQSAIADFVVEKYLHVHALNRFALLVKTGCDVGYCNIAMSPKSGYYTNDSGQCAGKYRPLGATNSSRWACPDRGIVAGFYQALKNAPVYSYAVSPKESIQRVANLSSHVQELNLALNTAAKVSSSANIEGLISLLRSEQKRVQSIKRQPLIVGFSDRYFATGKYSYNGLIERPPAVTHFGWLIGPKFDIGEKPTFHHVPIQNAVAAVVSVPSWWKRAKIEVASCFVAPAHTTMLLTKSDAEGSKSICGPEKKEADTNSGTGKNTTGDASKEARRNKRNFDFKIRLPGRADEIPRKIGYAVGRSPRLTSQGSLGALYVGQKEAKLLLFGIDLWRSTVVTVGSQKADGIEILPDMKGIIARFDDVKAPLRWGIEGRDGAQRRGNFCKAHAELFVWTSEGKTEPQIVTIYQSKEDFERGGCKRDIQPGETEPRNIQPEALAHLSVGTKNAELHIDGRNLQQVTHVTLGNQISSKTTPLGGGGIMAMFDEIKNPTDWPNGPSWMRVPVMVWGRDRKWSPGFACLYPKGVNLKDDTVPLCPSHGPQSGFNSGPPDSNRPAYPTK
ncbi:MAG: hypothetical protein O2967_02050 [Proteobacteria bacterium]|nr:hypothetical protein [Pseudomonadota bacterium]